MASAVDPGIAIKALCDPPYEGRRLLTETPSVFMSYLPIASIMSACVLVQQMSLTRTRTGGAEFLTVSTSLPTALLTACLSFTASAGAEEPFPTESRSSPTTVCLVDLMVTPIFWESSFSVNFLMTVGSVGQTIGPLYYDDALGSILWLCRPLGCCPSGLFFYFLVTSWIFPLLPLPFPSH